MDNTYENLTIEKPKALTVWEGKNDLWTRTIWSNSQNDVTKQLGNLQLKKIPIYGHTAQVPAKSKEWNKTSTPETAKGLVHDAHRLTSSNKKSMTARNLAFTHLLKQINYNMNFRKQAFYRKITSQNTTWENNHLIKIVRK